MPQMKRPAAATKIACTEPPAKRQQSVEDPLRTKYRAISTLLEAAEDCPTSVLQMLASAAWPCLNTPTEQRHEIQKGIIEMLAHMLLSIKTSHTTKVSTTQFAVAHTRTERETRAVCAEAAAVEEKTKANIVEVERLAHNEAANEKEAVETGLSVAEAVQEAGNTELAKGVARKASLMAAFSDLSVLRAGTATEVAGMIRNVIKAGVESGLEAQLLVSAEPTLGKAAVERGGFENMVLQMVEEQFNDAINELDEWLAGSEIAKAERTAAVTEAMEASAKATSKEATCRAKLEEAEVVLEIAIEARKVAWKSVEDLEPDMLQAVVDNEAALAWLAACEEILVTFQELVEGLPAEPDKATSEVSMVKAADATAMVEVVLASEDVGDTEVEVEVASVPNKAEAASAEEAAMAVEGALPTEFTAILLDEIKAVGIDAPEADAIGVIEAVAVPLPKKAEM